MMRKPSYRPFSSVVRPEAVIGLFLVLAVLTAYWEVRSHFFVNYDDGAYVYENPTVRKGLSEQGLRWAFTTTETGNWHPLTWISHMLDCSLFGPGPQAQHTTNLILHIINTLLLFSLFRSMTGGLWLSAFVAALFGLHPINVESVAWISQRKTVLSTLFGLLTMAAYIRYVARPLHRRYFMVVFFFMLGLMAKPMLVPLPFLLLLLDYWPLGRCEEVVCGGIRRLPASVGRVILEKVPLVVLSVAAGIVTIFAQHREGAVRSLDVIPMGSRILNALVSYVTYLGKLFWPATFAIPYPYPSRIGVWTVTLSVLVLCGISYASIKRVRKTPYLAVGWLWYLGMLLPVIGLLQVGSQAMADRYAYLSAVGIFVVISWGIYDFKQVRQFREAFLILPAGVCVIVLILLTRQQVGYWRDSISLFTRAVQVTEQNHTAHNNLGIALMESVRLDEAMDHFREVLRIKPRYKKAYNNLGIALSRQGKWDEAVEHYRKALQINPGYHQALVNLGQALIMQGNASEALEYLVKALESTPDSPIIHNLMGIARFNQNRFDEALNRFQIALTLDPDYADAHNNIGIALTAQGRPEDAIPHFETALRLNPAYSNVRENIEKALKTLGTGKK